MSSTDNPDDSGAYYECARALEALPSVMAADVLVLPDPRIDGSCIECVVGPEFDYVPSHVLTCVAEHDRGIRSVDPRGEPSHLVMAVV